MQRRAEFRPFSWLHDLWKRGQLDLSPPYQRRSVWPDRFRSDFVTTVLMNYPCPAIFLFEEIRNDGSFVYKVVDGKQRLTALFDFVSNGIQIAEDYPNQSLRGRLFDDLDTEIRLLVWRYSFSVEFIEQENESLINDIFNRINKNVAKLSQQELRHAMFSGRFITAAEELSERLSELLPSNFPNIVSQSRRQMKDVENTATMLLFIESGEKSTSQADLDAAFRDREEEWPEEAAVRSAFLLAVNYIKEIISQPGASQLTGTRLRNQADFYSLFAAIVELQRNGQVPNPDIVAERLSEWSSELRQHERDARPVASDHPVRRYLNAARAASNDAGPRRIRIDIVKSVILGGALENA